MSPDMVRHRGEDVRGERAHAGSIRSRAGPFFAWVHLFDPHAPYDPPEPYRGQYGQRPVGSLSRRSGARGQPRGPVARLARRKTGWLRRQPSCSSATTARAWAATASRVMASSSTTRRFASRSSSGSRISRPAGASPPRSSSIDLMPTVLERPARRHPAVGAGPKPARSGVRHARRMSDVEAYSETLQPT